MTTHPGERLHDGGETRAEGACLSLREVVQNLQSPDPTRRRDAIVRLARTRDPRAAPLLIRVIEGDPSAELRYLARKGMQYLKQGGSSAPSRRPLPKASVAERNPVALRRALGSSDAMERLKAIRIIQLDRTEGMAPLLAQRLEVEKDVGVQATLLEALGALGDESVVPRLVPWLRSRESRLRANAIEALGNTDCELALTYLIPHLRDPDNRCRGNAVLALRRSGRVNVHRTLEAMLRSPEVSMQDSATFCLGRMGMGREVFRLLALAMESRFTVTRNQARAVLRRLQERGSQRAEGILRRFGAEDEPEAVEDLLDKVRAPVEEAPEVYPTPEEKAAGLLQNLQGLSQLGPGEQPASDRSEEVLGSLQALGRDEAAPVALAPRREEVVLDSLRALALGAHGGGNEQARRQAQDQAVLSRLGDLGKVQGTTRDRREVREAELLNALRSLS